ncbi:MAG: FtsW/RodA/SpoVE family cell cycle protein [Anaerolineales bacterium]|nr:FtsW/RodA/SpoVE family cell cycle protein [Anaerolineales bacterium]
MRSERFLFSLAGLFVIASTAALALIPFARANTWAAAVAEWDLRFLLFPIIWMFCALAAHLITNHQLPNHDSFLLPITFLLTGWGLALIWRLTPNFGWRQTLWLMVATLALILTVCFAGDLRWLRRYRYTWLTLGLALTALTFLIGVNPEGSGARLWLGGLLGVFLQPVEPLKLLLVIFLAAYLAERREQIFSTTPHTALRTTHFTARFPYFLPLLLMWSFSMLLVIAQRDLGAGALFFGVFVVMLYLASGRAWVLGVGGVLLVLGGVGAFALFDVVRVRVEAWWNPWADPTGRSFQIVQALMALAAGGLVGSGPGLGAPTLVPVAHSDFIFAALAEEWGLAGMLAALGVLAALVLRGLHIALRARNPFNQLLAAGLATLTGLQALLIIGGVIKVIPLTGVTLPFMSYGGSSLVVQFVMVGLLLRLSSNTNGRN